jgi:tRNA-methyltransferase O
MMKKNTKNTQVKKTKIRPPRAGGIKMGQLATRSPHRPNCLGLSLVTVERWDCQTKRLHMRGIDLVNGTPVYDIKPFVPWDVPTAPPGAVVPAPLQQQKQHNSDNGNGNHVAFFKVPNWVSQTEDVLSRVDFTPAAQDSLCTLVSQRRLAPLYTNDNDGFVAALATLQQILAQDPRSSHKGLKVNARGTTSYAAASSCSSNRSNNSNNSKKRQDKTDDARSPPFYSLVFCQVQVDFVVNYAASHVQVVQCLAVDFDDAAYVDGVPLISEQQQQQQHCSLNKY